MSLNAKTVKSGHEISDLFAEYFSSVYVRNNNGKPTTSFGNSISSVVNDNGLNVSLFEVFDAISNLPDSCKCGPDGIPSLFLKNCIFTLSEPLLFLFRSSLSEAAVPDVWKQSYITPIFKSGEKNKIDNYRGVCFQSIIPKILDSIVAKQLQWISSPILREQQHGFRQNKSTLSNLLEYYTFLNEAFVNYSQVDSIYTDFSKAFDRVNHELLISKLYRLGFHDSTVRWLSSFLSGRWQQVKIGNYISQRFEVTSGVPQGSHCGPILFLLFINDLSEQFKFSYFLFFADDLKLFKCINCIKDATDLQRDLDSLHEWCECNQLYLNINKCQAISFSNKKCNINFSYKLGDTNLNFVSEVKDLGVIFDSKLTFKSHYYYIVEKALKLWGFVWRNCKDLSTAALKTLYCALVRSHLEYCSPVWSPFYSGDKKLLERVQNKFLRFMEYKLSVQHQRGEYSWIMSTLNLQSLEARRNVMDACTLHGLINGSISSPSLLTQLCFLIPSSDSRLTRSKLIFRIRSHSTNLAKNNPIRRMMEFANQFAADNRFCLFSSSKASFRRQLLLFY